MPPAFVHLLYVFATSIRLSANYIENSMRSEYCWAMVVSQVFPVCIRLIVCVSLGLGYVYYSKANVNAAKALA